MPERKARLLSRLESEKGADMRDGAKKARRLQFAWEEKKGRQSRKRGISGVWERQWDLTIP